MAEPRTVSIQAVRGRIVTALKRRKLPARGVYSLKAENDVWVQVFQNDRALQQQVDNTCAILTEAGYKIDRVEPNPSWSAASRWIFIDVEHARAKILQERAARAEAKARTSTATKLEEALLAACRTGTKAEALAALDTLWDATRG